MLSRPIELHTLTDGGETAEAVAERDVTWLGVARRSLDLALYDVRLPGAVGDRVGEGDQAGGGGRRRRADRVRPGRAATRRR